MDVKEKLVELIAKAKEIYAGDYTDHTEDEYIAEMLLDNGVTVQEWIPVTERLPEPKENPVLVVYGGCVWAAWKHDNYWEIVPGLNTTCVTHWMPMLEPPKEG